MNSEPFNRVGSPSMSRVWRYRGGRDGHETLQQFMNFLGREKTEPPEPVRSVDQQEEERGGAELRLTIEGASSSEERDKGGISETTDRDERLGPNTYGGVVVFCVPVVAETGRDIDLNSFQVKVPRSIPSSLILHAKTREIASCNIELGYSQSLL